MDEVTKQTVENLSSRLYLKSIITPRDINSGACCYHCERFDDFCELDCECCPHNEDVSCSGKGKCLQFNVYVRSTDFCPLFKYKRK